MSVPPAHFVNMDVSEIESCLINAIRTGERPLPPYSSHEAQRFAARAGIPESAMAAEDAHWERDWCDLCQRILAILPILGFVP